MPTKPGVYNVRLKRSTPKCREILDIRAFYWPKTGHWLSEDGLQILGSYEQVTMFCTSGGGWKVAKVDGI